MDASSDLDHRAVLAALGKERVAALAVLSNVPGLTRLGVHLGALGVTGWTVLALEGLWRLPAQLAHGVLLVFLFSALHESIHRTAFRTPWLNDLVAAVAGFTFIQPPLGFRYFHFAHHRYTQDPEHDPELGIPKPKTRLQYVIYLSGWYFWTGQPNRLVKTALGRPLPGYVPARARDRVIREARAYLMIYAAIVIASALSGSTLVLTLWLVPTILGQPFMRAYLLAEHTGCPLVPDMLDNTRTTFCHRAIRWLAWEMPWHTAHHAAPTAPSTGSRK